MTQIRTLLGIAMLAGILAFTVFPAAAQQDSSDGSNIKWYSYEDGMEKLKDSGKKGYLHFYTDWCSYCRLMEEKTFSDSDVADYLNTNFIAMRVNAEKQEDVAQTYRVKQFPLNWFLDKNAEPIGNQPGYIPPEQMVDMLRYVSTDGYKTMNFQEFMEKQKN